MSPSQPPRSQASESTAMPALGARRLLLAMRSGELSSVELVASCLRRLDEIQPRLNCVVFRRDEEALREAEAIDRRRRAGEALGQLAGLPVTLKECFQLAGSSATMGLRRLANSPAAEDGPIAARLKAAGAILIAKTNVPQLMLMHETDGPLFGRANHPLDSQRGPGGSSGGEAATIAAGGSCLGIGSDLGGSIRQPAHACGIAGLLPTPGRLTVCGCRLNYPRAQAIHMQPGPLARRVEDLSLAMQAIAPRPTAQGLLGPQLDEAPAAWNELRDDELAGLRVATFEDDGIFTPSPAIRRAVREAAAKLRQAGVTVETFVPPGLDELLELYVGLLSADGMRGLKHLLGGEAPDWRLRRMIHLGSLPNLARPFFSAYYRWRSEPRLAELISLAGPRSAEGYLRLCERLVAFSERFFAALRAGSFSALLFPPHGLPALTHGDSANLLSAASYCFLPNLLGIPAGVVPMTTVRADEQSDRDANRAADATERSARRVEQNSAGLPIAVQVAAAPWREDIVLGLMRLLEN